MVKILVVDDTPADRKIISRFLKKEGFDNIIFAETGAQGLGKVKEESPDLIILDTILPDQLGFDVCRSIRKIPHAGKAKIIMATGKIDAVDAVKAKDAGADDYCVKTADCKPLIDSVRKNTEYFGSGKDKALLDKTDFFPKDESDLKQRLREMEAKIKRQEWGLRKTEEGIRTLYSELEKKNEQLKKLDKLKSDFISTVSHELRTPLAIIRESVSQVLEGITGPVTQEQNELLSLCIEDADRLSRIIDNLLDISKIEAGKVELRKEEFDLAEAVKKVSAGFSKKIKGRNIILKLDLSSDKIIVYADKDKVIQVFNNLIGNALKFTERGEVIIEVRDEEESILCSVEDSGIGISEEDIPKVFDKFQQFGRVPGPGSKGTGLGLSIVKGIIELHKGRIDVESRLGKGTKFVFALPKKTDNRRQKTDDGRQKIENRK